MNICITSEHRVGSRWLHYLLADLLEMSTSPEIDKSKIRERKDIIHSRFKDNKIVKFHHAEPIEIMSKLQPNNYKIIGVVRNPRDRGVSKAFHDYYHPKHNYKVKSVASTDKEAVEFIILNSENYIRDNNRQIKRLMLDGYSTRKYLTTQLPYIWTSYEWMKENIVREIKSICKFLGITKSFPDIVYTINKHTFERKSGRAPGVEKRADNWRRKGVVGDWKNWFTEEMIKATEDIQQRYWKKLELNSGG